jgi:CubicO group peptidase (beta-lactamase class C family)
MSLVAHLAPKEIQRHIFATGFADLPGESHYSNLPAYLLGIIAERVGGKKIDVLARETFFEPLNMSSTFFGLGPESTDISVYSTIAPTETEESGDVVGIVHDESARAFAREGIAVGHAGLFSNAPDLTTFLEALLAGSFPYIVKGAQKGLGWELNRGTFMGSHFGPRTFGKTGFTGTSVVCDCDRGIGLVILSNRTYPSRPHNNEAISAFRRSIADLVLK